MRGKQAKKRILSVDSVYGELNVTHFINKLILKGKKDVASKLFYQAIKKIEDTTQKSGIEVFKTAIENVTPYIKVQPLRVGGATYQIPKEVSKERGVALSIRWIIQAARKMKGKSMADNIARELIDASNNTGNAIKKRTEVHKMAESNKVFTHFSR